MCSQCHQLIRQSLKWTSLLSTTLKPNQTHLYKGEPGKASMVTLYKQELTILRKVYQVEQQQFQHPEPH